MYINTQTLTQHTESEIRSLNPNTSFGTPFVPPAEYALVFPAPQPVLTEFQSARQIAPELTVLGTWEQRWEAVDIYSDYTDAEGVLHTKVEQEATVTEAKRIASVPQTVTMRQARLALLSAGLLAGVDAAIAGLTEPTKSAAQIEWEYAAAVQRSSGLVPAMATALGMTELQIDDLFIAANQL